MSVLSNETMEFVDSFASLQDSAIIINTEHKGRWKTCLESVGLVSYACLASLTRICACWQHSTGQHSTVSAVS